MFVNRYFRYALYVAVAVATFAGGFWLRATQEPVAKPTQSAAEVLWALKLPDFDNKSQSLDQWKGKVLVLNFWATWCGPCREEIPQFVKMQHDHGGKGLQFVGISIDQIDKTREFAAKFNINYPTLIGGFDTVDVSQKAGNTKRGLPFTVVLDRRGGIVSTDIGGVTREKLEAIVTPLL